MRTILAASAFAFLGGAVLFNGAARAQGLPNSATVKGESYRPAPSGGAVGARPDSSTARPTTSGTGQQGSVTIQGAGQTPGTTITNTDAANANKR